METTNQNDDLIGKVMSDPEKTISDLQKAAETIKNLKDAAQGAQQDVQNAMQENDDESTGNEWGMNDTIDTLLSRITGGYTYYDIPWDERNKPKMDDSLFNIMDDSGDSVETNKTKEDVLDFANTLFHYDMADNDEEELKTFDDAKAALESNGYKVVNVNDTNQLSLFPKEKQKTSEPNYGSVISKMSEPELNRVLDNMDPYKANGVKKTIQLLKLNKQPEAYKLLRSIADSLRENENAVNNFGDSEIFRIIAESERPKITKEEILNYIKSKKNL